MIEFSAALCLVAALAFGALLLRTRGRLRQALAASAVLDTVPLASFRWAVGQEDDGDDARAASYREFIAGLTAGDAERIEAARLALQRVGTAFSAAVAAPGGRAYMIEGRRTATGEAVLWLVDTSAAAIAEKARHEAASLREMLDAVPVPVWRRGADHALVECNRAYAHALETTPQLALAEGRELAPGARPGERRHVVIGGSRRLVEIDEVPCGTGESIGFVLDRTDIETAEAEL